MRIDASQRLGLEQQMKLSPRIIQAMEILQLPLMALQERIEAEMTSNPVLELRDPGVDEEAPAQTEEADASPEAPLVVHDKGDHKEDFQRLAEYEDEHQPWEHSAEAGPRYDPGERDRKLDAMANAPAPGESLAEHLARQWAFIEAPAEIKQAGLRIIQRIEDDGYLRTPLEDLTREIVGGDPNPPAAGGMRNEDLEAHLLPEENPQSVLPALQAALPRVQALDPIGVGARDLKESLLLQLGAEEAAGRDMSLERLLVERYLRDIEMNRLPAIAKRAHKTVEQVKAALHNLSHLNPRPGLLVGRRPAPVITPDVMVDIDDDGEVVVWLPTDTSPALHISRSYQKLAKDRKTAKDARAFLQRNIRSAQWLIGAIEQRRQTVRRVAQEVFKVQREFVFHGPEALKPLPMQDIANKVGVHVATVSRAVAGKYAQTPWGILPLRDFFAGGTTTSGGADVSWDAVKLKLKELVDAEDKKDPLDDDTLAAEMQKHGIKIARRTVAKYRDILNIPPARKRRQY